MRLAFGKSSKSWNSRNGVQILEKHPAVKFRPLLITSDQCPQSAINIAPVINLT
jgi:hypothetical protein